MTMSLRSEDSLIARSTYGGSTLALLEALSKIVILQFFWQLLKILGMIILLNPILSISYKPDTDTSPSSKWIFYVLVLVASTAM
jgi:uncharacterized membrane protein YhaH (DUF805 family)